MGVGCLLRPAPSPAARECHGPQSARPAPSRPLPPRLARYFFFDLARTTT